MFKFLRRKKKQKKSEEIGQSDETLGFAKLQSSLKKNIQNIQEIFKDVDILKLKYIDNEHDKNLKYCIVYCDGVVNSKIINESIIKPLILSSAAVRDKNLVYNVMNCVLQINEMEKTKEIKKIIDAISYGSTVLFIDGEDEAIILNTKNFLTRAIEEPDNEKNISGPREGFNESLLANLSLIRRKVCTNELKMKFYNSGKRTQTKTCICYMDGLVNKKSLDRLYKRLDKIDIDAVLDANYISELIKDNRKSPFRATGYTQKPDVVIGKLLEGRIAIFVDGSPGVLTVPYLFIENFQSGEDYYLNFYYTSFSRFLRMFGFFLTIAVPALYVAIVAFHHEMMPTSLLINVALERKSVPLPAALECFVLLIVFDILRETGVRMPSNIGQALSIVGALVIGQAAVQAKLVAAPMIIVVAITGITNLLVPKLNAPVIYIRLGLLFISSALGLFGLMIGLCALTIHILNLKSLGISQTMLPGEYSFQDNKDILIRAPWWKMTLRPKDIAEDMVRMRESTDNEND